MPRDRGRRPRARLALGLALAAAAVGGYWGLLWAVPEGMVRAPNAGLSGLEAGDPGPEALEKLGVRSHLRISVGPPAASLSCFVIEPPAGSPPRATVLVLHGIRDGKHSQLGTGRFLAGLGYRAVLVDSRGQGRSTGSHLTYGILESRDLVQVLDWLEQHGLFAEPAGAFGFSYGGSTAIQLAGKDPRVVAVVSVSTFASVRAALRSYLERFLPVAGRWIPEAHLDRILDRASRRAGLDLREADTVAAMRRGTARILILHGEDDRKLPPLHARQLHAAAPDRSELVLVPAEDHDSMMADRTGEVRRRARDWLARWLAMREPPPPGGGCP